jgi:hypothetical protein
VKVDLDKINVATVCVLAVILLGVEQTIAGHIDFDTFFKYAAQALGLLAVGRGISARSST